MIEACIERARSLLAAAVAAANARRGTAFDPMRGMYVVEAEVDDILTLASRRPPKPEGHWMIPDVARISADRAVHDALALCIAVEYVPRLDRVVGFLHDDLTRRTLSVALLVEMLGIDPRAFSEESLLVRLGVFAVAHSEVPMQSTVRIDRGLLEYLDCGTPLDRRLQPFASEIRVAPRMQGEETYESPLVLWGASADDVAAAARELCESAGRSALRVNGDAPAGVLGIAARDALLRDELLVLEVPDPAAAREVALAFRDVPLPVIVEAPGGIVRYDGPARRVRRSPARAVSSPAGYPLPYGRRMYARRTMEDLILPPHQVRAIRSIAGRMQQRDRVVGTWGVDTGSGSAGVRALFAGPPGTGKTLAAEALARELGRDLYVVDVSMVISKYIGETEKALATIFAEAARAGVVLFFDEADAYFGKRTETKDAHDRYANIETAYLLQALDLYADVAILATNMASNIDDALVRRIDVKVEFAMPDAGAREELWKRTLGNAPLELGDFRDVAKRVPLSGGGIQSAALSAAFAAAGGDRPVTTLDLLRAARDELGKAGRIAGRLELGEYYDALRLEL